MSRMRKSIVLVLITLLIIMNFNVVYVLADSIECVNGGGFDTADDIKNWGVGQNQVEWIDDGVNGGYIKVVPPENNYISLSYNTTLKKNQWYLTKMKVKLLPAPDGSRTETEAKMMVMQANFETRTITKVNSDEWTEVYGCFKYITGDEQKTSPLFIRIGQNQADKIKYGAYVDEISVTPFGNGQIVAGGDFEDYHTVLSTSSYSDADRWGNNTSFRCDPFIGVRANNATTSGEYLKWCEGGQHGNDTGHILMKNSSGFVSLQPAYEKIQQGVWYRVSARGKLAGNDNNVGFKILTINDISNNSGNVYLNAGDDWKESISYVKLVGNEFVDGKFQIRVGQEGSLPTQGIYIDDFIVEKVDTAKVINGGFEEETPFVQNGTNGAEYMPWRPTSTNNVSYSKDKSFLGNNSLKISNGDYVKQERTFTSGILNEVSAAVNVEGLDTLGESRAYASLYFGNELIGETLVDEGWNRVRTYTDSLNGTDYVSVKINIKKPDGSTDASKTLTYYIDDIHAEAVENQLINGDFGCDTFGWNVSGDAVLSKNNGYGTVTVTPAQDTSTAFLSQNIELAAGTYSISFETDNEIEFALGNIIDTETVNGSYYKNFTIDSNTCLELQFSSESEISVRNVKIESYEPAISTPVYDGDKVIGSTLTVDYTYKRYGDEPNEGESKVVWYISSRPHTNEWTKIGEGSKIHISDEYLYKYIMAEVTPVDENGIAGKTVRGQNYQIIKRFDIQTQIIGSIESLNLGFHSVVHNNTNTGKYVTLMLCVYDQSGRMCDVVCQKELVEAQGSKLYAKTISLSNEATSAKIIYWSSGESYLTDMNVIYDYLDI